MATVEPWVMHQGVIPRQICSAPLRNASAGSRGVDGTLCIASFRPSARTKSVNVPPVSMPRSGMSGYRFLRGQDGFSPVLAHVTR